MASLFTLLDIFYLFPLVTAQGSVALFLDKGCQHPSKINPLYNLHLDICLVTDGVSSVVAETLPNCDSGNATLALYRDMLCATSLSGRSNSGCLYHSPNYSIPAVMFVCEASVYPTVRDTLTVSASQSSSNTGMAFATDNLNIDTIMTATTTSSTPLPIIPSTQSPNISKSTALTPASSASLSTSLSSTTDGGGSIDSGLSQSDRIALGVGLSVPIAAIVVAVLIWQCPKKTGGEP